LNELQPLFPQSNEVRSFAVRVLLELEAGPVKQSALVSMFDVKKFEMSRLLTKLETGGLISRKREGTDKIVTLSHRMDLPTERLDLEVQQCN